jgi:hypothetical protein
VQLTRCTWFGYSVAAPPAGLSWAVATEFVTPDTVAPFDWQAAVLFVYNRAAGRVTDDGVVAQ